MKKFSIFKKSLKGKEKLQKHNLFEDTDELVRVNSFDNCDDEYESNSSFDDNDDEFESNSSFDNNGDELKGYNRIVSGTEMNAIIGNIKGIGTLAPTKKDETNEVEKKIR